MRLLALAAFGLLLVEPAFAAVCTGDCDGDGRVEPREVAAAAAALFDADDCEGIADVADLLRAVRHHAEGCGWRFRDVTVAAGLFFTHTFGTDVHDAIDEQAVLTMGGVAAGDYDGDGWIDLYATGGDRGTNRLFRNQGDGTFAERAAQAGLAIARERSCGPTFADVDGDGRLDLFIGGVAGTRSRLMRSRGDGTFEDVFSDSGLELPRHTFSAAFGDYDGDGRLDLALSHWGSRTSAGPIEHLWRNLGGFRFAPAGGEDALAGFGTVRCGDTEQCIVTFTPTFADIDGDGRLDLLYAGDFRTSRVFLNRGDGTFANATTAVISDENGMGAAVGDYDGDGHLDWFVSSIHDPSGTPAGFWGISGNRLYRNDGAGGFEDVTEEAGVGEGYWGWGSCFADFDNDGHLDLFHVNGFQLNNAVEFQEDPSRLFVNDGDGTFSERSAELGLVETDQGRGVVCFDYDRDGDIDVFVANSGQPPRLWRNDGGNFRSFLSVRLRGRAPNTEGIGARVYVSAGGRTQMREIHAGSNFVSQNPALAHFGLGHATGVDEVRVVWPNGAESRLGPLPARQELTIAEDPPLRPMAPAAAR